MLISLRLHTNRFTGQIPLELSRLSLLQALTLNDNAMEGEIPHEFFQLKQLNILKLQNNQFRVPISESFSELKLLSTLILSGNNFQGSIPRHIFELSPLLSLDISNNNLTGPIIVGMKSSLMYLNLSHNSFTETIPEDIGKLEKAEVIDISTNDLSGTIPETIKNCRNLLVLDMSNNKLSGPLGEIFSDMEYLTNLNLSQNQIKGKIPANLANLKHLSAVNLSWNDLEGEIPQNFSVLSSLKHLNLSHNQLEGPVPQSGVFKNMPESNLAGNKGLCGTKSLGLCTKRSHGQSRHSLSRKTRLIMIPLVCISALLLFLIAIMSYKHYQNKRKLKEHETCNVDYTAALVLQRFETKDIETATEFFSEHNIIGSSNLSTVYKGRLEDGQIVAIKKLNLQQFAAESDKYFNREAKILSQLRHRNLVKVIGYAWESRKLKALDLEYMEQGNLEKIIHDPSVDRSTWILSKRIDVCISIAEAMFVILPL
uniref:Protein kinase domain-containing protein n=2 Tax=Chenopodium quinoa TaxID=63459 RepID=A0A803MDP5_CHEQI